MEIKALTAGSLRAEVAVLVGTRPGIIMFAPIIHEFERQKVPFITIHSGQHYSPSMDAEMFDDLGLPQPQYRLEGVAEKRTHGAQTAAMLEGIEAILLERRPALLLVNGDANTHLAGALAARKLHIAVAHVEAGERSNDWRMPEEHNRVIIDHISDLLFATNQKGLANLQAEGVKGRAYVVGNPLIDASLKHCELARSKSTILDRLGVAPKEYAVLTMHREENVDNAERLQNALNGVSQAATENGWPVIFPAHPRTTKRLKEFGLDEWARSLSGITISPALAYLDFLNLLVNSRLVFTDSGGVQQEACLHQAPCVTLRENTEWTETMEIGANRLAGTDPEAICRAVAAWENGPRQEWSQPFGPPGASRRIVECLRKELASPRAC
jgi:UDP-N-acetylglucosamine 2-epimerase (non-hydrolysing)